ncbi:MAG TPA: UDP-N-acetylmuramate dehydrogenase [Candidatus Dormibacteraeota bacterium]|nr:UDP-N-acetylmuramate dehydrogenase [Candidatus Dormibacteraeota bacterium]
MDAAAPLDLVALAGEIARRVGVKAERGMPLGKLTTMRVGGPADLLATAHNAFELRALVRFARARDLPLTLLGRGSNVVISDRGVRGLVVNVRAEGSRIDGAAYVAEAGLPMARAATETQKAGLSGLEFGLAIPGTVGGAVWANAGAHGADVRAVLESADVLLADGSEARLPAAELGLAYRESRFKHQDAESPAEVVIGARFRLQPASEADIKARLDDIRHWRQAHQPLGIPSAGSAFRNPPDGPSAGALIEAAGLKGLQEGGATVSEKHANFVVNDRRGTAADVRRLMDRVRARILESDGVDLVPEIVFVGDWAGWPWPAADGGAA